jgi:hypothetical protein
MKSRLLVQPEVLLPQFHDSVDTSDFPGLPSNRIQQMTTQITARYKLICSVPWNSWKWHWQCVSSSFAVLHNPLPQSLLMCPAQPSWFARFLPGTAPPPATRTHTLSHSLTQDTFPDCKPQYRKHTAVPVNSMSHPLAWSLGTGSWLDLVIYFSQLNVVFKSVWLSVIWMLFSKLRDFIRFSLFLSYNVQLCYYFPFIKIWQLNIEARITSSYWLCYVAPKIYFLRTLPNSHTNMRDSPTCNFKYQYLNWHPPFLLQPFQMAHRKTLCGACSLRNFTSLIIGTLTDATLWLQMKRKSCIKRTIVIINRTQ